MQRSETVGRKWEGIDLKALFVTLLVIWAVLAVVGFALKGLVWLAIIGIILFIGTIILGAIRRASVRRRTTT